MKVSKRRGRRGQWRGWFMAAICLAVVPASGQEQRPRAVQAEPRVSELRHGLSWVGNSLSGADNQWVQNYVDEIEVSPDGTVYTASQWDENGRCTGAYRDGTVDPRAFRQYDGKGGHTAWGWGTASDAVAIDDAHLYVSNTAGQLLRFDRKTHAYLEQVDGVGKAVGMTIGGGRAFVLLPEGVIEVRQLRSLGEVAARFTVAGAKDLAADAAGNVWVAAGTEMVRRSPSGEALPGGVTGLTDAVAVSVDPKGRLIVCDGGERQQVLIYDVAGGAPRLVGTFGDKGGIASGTPGEVTPSKLIALSGAGADARGDLYVAMSGGIWNGVILRKYPADLKPQPVWELKCLHFVDAAVVDPASDGNAVYSAEEAYTVDPAKPAGKDWTLKGFTADPAVIAGDAGKKAEEASDPRVDPGVTTMFARRIGEDHRLVLYQSGMTGGPLYLYTFENDKAAPGKQGFARLVHRFARRLGGWGAYADTLGDIWECGNGEVGHTPFKGFDADGKPTFGDTRKEPSPAPFTDPQRVIYDREHDVMYVGGYTAEKPEETWGIVGKVFARYDDWSKGNRTAKWTIDLPHDFREETDPRLIIKVADVAGDYLFLAGVMTRGKVWIYRTSDGKPVGTLTAGDAVGGTGATGWVDTVAGMSTFKRANGEYMVLLEEDARGKVLVFRWRPEGSVAD